VSIYLYVTVILIFPSRSYFNRNKHSFSFEFMCGFQRLLNISLENFTQKLTLLNIISFYIKFIMNLKLHLWGQVHFFWANLILQRSIFNEISSYSCVVLNNYDNMHHLFFVFLFFIFMVVGYLYSNL